MHYCGVVAMQRSLQLAMLEEVRTPEPPIRLSALFYEPGSAADVARLCADNPDVPVPIDLVTTSASGLDPHISPAAAMFQVRRVARERGLPEAAVRELVQAHTEGRQFGVLGSIPGRLGVRSGTPPRAAPT